MDKNAVPNHTPDQVNSALEKANEQYHNWKQILSGALNDKQLVWGLAVIFCFYVFYSVFNTAIGNGQDEDDLTCKCPMFHRWFYRAIVFVSGVIWIVCFVSIAIYDTYMFITLYRNPASNESTDGITGTSEKYSAKLDDKLKLCENHLWLEFYKAYSVGSAAYEKVVIPQDIRIIINMFTTKDVNDDNSIQGGMNDDNTRQGMNDDNTRQGMNDGNTRQGMNDDNTRRGNDETDFGNDETDFGKDETDFGKKEAEKVAKQTFVFFYSFLVIVRFLAQLVVIPMLILQMLSTYAWICITEDYHCQSAVTHYQLGLYQAYITFGFYIALLIAILATTMLRWFPHSKDARDVGAASYA